MQYDLTSPKNKNSTSTQFYNNIMKNSCKITGKLWILFYIVGTYITAVNIYNNFAKYRRHDSLVIQRHTERNFKYFPKLVICPNSMHSKAKVKQEYPMVTETILQTIYGACRAQHCLHKKHEPVS